MGTLPSDGSQKHTMSDVYRTMASIETRIWWGPVLRGLIAAVLGVIIFSLNAGSNDALNLAYILIGVFALANGAIGLITVFLDRSGAPRTLPAVVAVISLVLGLLLVIWPTAMAKITIVLLGLFLLVMGGAQIYAGGKLRAVDPTRRFNGLLVLGIVLIILGLATALLPIFVARVFIFVAALVLICVGVTFVAIGMSIRSAMRA